MLTFLRALLTGCLLTSLTQAVYADGAISLPIRDWPASFEGTLPCASCEGIDTSITLNADNTFLMRQIYVGAPGPNRADDLGRWVLSSHGNIVVLKGQGGYTRYFRLEGAEALTMLDLEARTIFSDLNYTLRRTPELTTPELSLFPLSGLYRYQADAGVFTECVSGLTLPVLQRSDNARLEQGYLSVQQQAGEALLATVYGRIVEAPTMEGDNRRLSLDPLRFESVQREVCPPLLNAKSLTDHFWTLTQLNGKPVVLPEGRRLPGLTFHSESQRLSGFGGCNQLLGKYTLNGALIELGMLAATRMACMNQGNVEQELMLALSKVQGWNVIGQRLELFDQLGRLLARFESPE